jgi:hypothetical protein
MADTPGIAVGTPAGQNLNGLGMMVVQYLEQDFAEYPHKVLAASRIRCRIAMEVDKGIAITVSFRGNDIVVENGVGHGLDLHIQAPYLLLSQVLCGTASPFVEFIRRRIRLKAFPRRPIESLKVLRLLKIQQELRIDT